MSLIDMLALPARVTVAATQVTLGLGQLVASDGPVRRDGGYAERVLLIIGENGLVERITRVLSDPQGPIALLSTLAAMTSGDRPLGKAIATDGALDRMLAEDGPVYRILREDGLLDRLLADDGFMEKLVAEGGTLDQLVALGVTLEAILPRLTDLNVLIPDLHEAVTTLNRAVEPLGDLAGRLPRARRRVIED